MEIAVHHAELAKIGDRPYYVLTTEITHDDGTVEAQAHIMPTDTLEWRAAEYDLDPGTTQGWSDLLNLVLYEQHLDAGGPEEQLADPDGLWQAPTVAAARKARMGRVKTRRGKGRARGVPGPSAQKAIVDDAVGIMGSGEQDPLEFIKQTAPISAEHLQVKREYVRRVRGRVRARHAGRDPVQLADLDAISEQAAGDTARSFVARTPLPERESAEALAARLLGQARHPTGVDPADDEGAR